MVKERRLKLGGLDFKLYVGGEKDEKEITATRFWVYVIKITVDKLKK